MSVFSDMAGSARDAHQHYFAESVTLAEPGIAARNVSAVLGKVRTETRDAGGRKLRVTVRNCRFPELSAVNHEAVVTAEGADWTIDEVLRLAASGLHVRLYRQQMNDVTRDSYRGKG